MIRSIQMALSAAFIVLCFVGLLADNGAMTKCLETHSYSICKAMLR